MLSAVELHSGGGSGFYPTFNRPPPVSNDPFTTPQQMSGAEFARPKPKSISSSNSLLNGLSPSAISPPSHKYSHHLQHEQNGPVNLAVNHHHHQSSQQVSTPDKEQNSDKEIDVVGLGNGNSGNSISFSTASSNPRISSFPTGLGTNAYQALNYSFYGNRYRSVINIS